MFDVHSVQAAERRELGETRTDGFVRFVRWSGHSGTRGQMTVFGRAEVGERYPQVAHRRIPVVFRPYQNRPANESSKMSESSDPPQGMLRGIRLFRGQAAPATAGPDRRHLVRALGCH